MTSSLSNYLPFLGARRAARQHKTYVWYRASYRLFGLVGLDPAGNIISWRGGLRAQPGRFSWVASRAPGLAIAMPLHWRADVKRAELSAAAAVAAAGKRTSAAVTGSSNGSLAAAASPPDDGVVAGQGNKHNVAAKGGGGIATASAAPPPPQPPGATTMADTFLLDDAIPLDDKRLRLHPWRTRLYKISYWSVLYAACISLATAYLCFRSWLPSEELRRLLYSFEAMLSRIWTVERDWASDKVAGLLSRVMPDPWIDAVRRFNARVARLLFLCVTVPAIDYAVQCGAEPDIEELDRQEWDRRRQEEQAIRQNALGQAARWRRLALSMVVGWLALLFVWTLF